MDYDLWVLFFTLGNRNVSFSVILRGTAPLTKNYHVLCPISKLSTPL